MIFTVELELKLFLAIDSGILVSVISMYNVSVMYSKFHYKLLVCAIFTSDICVLNV